VQNIDIWQVIREATRLHRRTTMIEARNFGRCFIFLSLFCMVLMAGNVYAADKLIGLHSAQVTSQSMPWIAQEAGLFKKHDLDFQLIFISSSGVATAATLGGDAEIALTGGIGNVRAYVQGASDIVFIGGVKNILTLALWANRTLNAPRISRVNGWVSAGSAAIHIILSSRR
jgi:hypothetical protein